MKQKLIMILCTLLLISGCTTKEVKENIDESMITDAIEKGDYRANLPFEVNSSRIKHAQTSTDLSQAFIIGSGLMNYSKQYFDSQVYTYKEGQFLTYNALDAFDDGMGLLGRTRESNPNGMNPEIGALFQTNKGEQAIADNDVLVSDILEIDWYKDKEFAGLSIAIVLNDRIGENDAIIEESQLKTYGEEVGRKVVSYLRKTHPEIGSKTPIYVALFKKNSYNNSLPGVFIEEAYFSSRTSADYKTIQESYLLFPSDEASSFDATNATYFKLFKDSIKDFFPEDTSVIASGYIKENALAKLTIEIQMHAKTWSEANALIQSIKANLSIFEDLSFEIKVEISCDDDVIAIMQRNADSEEVEAIVLVD